MENVRDLKYLVIKNAKGMDSRDYESIRAACGKYPNMRRELPHNVSIAANSLTRVKQSGIQKMALVAYARAISRHAPPGSVIIIVRPGAHNIEYLRDLVNDDDKYMHSLREILPNKELDRINHILDSGVSEDVMGARLTISERETEDVAPLLDSRLQADQLAKAESHQNTSRAMSDAVQQKILTEVPVIRDSEDREDFTTKLQQDIGNDVLSSTIREKNHGQTIINAPIRTDPEGHPIVEYPDLEQPFVVGGMRLSEQDNLTCELADATDIAMDIAHNARPEMMRAFYKGLGSISRTPLPEDFGSNRNLDKPNLSRAIYGSGFSKQFAQEREQYAQIMYEPQKDIVNVGNIFKKYNLKPFDSMMFDNMRHLHPNAVANEQMAKRLRPSVDTTLRLNYSSAGVPTGMSSRPPHTIDKYLRRRALEEKKQDDADDDIHDLIRSTHRAQDF
jgi:hypothetical protein